MICNATALEVEADASINAALYETPCDKKREVVHKQVDRIEHRDISRTVSVEASCNDTARGPPRRCMFIPPLDGRVGELGMAHLEG